MKNLIALSQWAIIREIFLLRYKALLHQKLKWKKPRFTYNFYFPVNFSIRNVSPEIENIMWLKTYTNFVSEYISISWSTCSFPAFISEFDTNHIFRVLSIPSDPFQELPYQFRRVHLIPKTTVSIRWSLLCENTEICIYTHINYKIQIQRKTAFLSLVGWFVTSLMAR